MSQLTAAFAIESGYRSINAPIVMVDERLKAVSVAALAFPQIVDMSSLETELDDHRLREQIHKAENLQDGAAKSLLREQTLEAEIESLKGNHHREAARAVFHFI